MLETKGARGRPHCNDGGCKLEVRIKPLGALLTIIGLCSEDRRCGFELWIKVHRGPEFKTPPGTKLSQKQLHTRGLPTIRTECKQTTQIWRNVWAAKQSPQVNIQHNMSDMVAHNAFD